MDTSIEKIASLLEEADVTISELTEDRDIWKEKAENLEKKSDKKADVVLPKTASFEKEDDFEMLGEAHDGPSGYGQSAEEKLDNFLNY